MRFYENYCEMMDNIFKSFVLVLVVCEIDCLDFQEGLEGPYAGALQQNADSTAIQSQISESARTIMTSITTYHGYISNLTDQVLVEYQSQVHEKVTRLKSSFLSTKSRSAFDNAGSSVVVRCIEGNWQLDSLAEKVNEEIKTCATVALAEMVNVISSSLNEAQAFMTIPMVIGKDIQTCGLNYTCRWLIVSDSINEAVQVPPKVFALTAKIQQLVLKTVVSIDTCGLKGLKNITKLGLRILQDIFSCISTVIEETARQNTNV